MADDYLFPGITRKITRVSAVLSRMTSPKLTNNGFNWSRNDGFLKAKEGLIFEKPT